jgi:hypothetical protein
MWLWRCYWLPWHRMLDGGFFVHASPSGAVQVKQCSCGRQYAVHHGMEAVIPWDDKTKKFYADMAQLELKAPGVTSACEQAVYGDD